MDKATLAQLRSSDVTSWLLATGWEHVHTVPAKFARFTKNLNGECAEVEVPIRAELRDFALRLAEVLDMLAAVEQRSPLDVLHDIRHPQVGLRHTVEGCALDTRFTWSRNRPRPEAVAEVMVFSPDRAPILESVARDFRAREPLADFELRGPILELASDDPALGGVLTIGGAVENRVVKVRAQVDPATYSRAIQAHKDKLTISLEGELTREGRSFALRSPRRFAVESEE